MTRQENAQNTINGLKKLLKDFDDFRSAGVISEQDLNNLIRPSQREVLEKYFQGDLDGNPFETGLFDLATGFGKTRVMTLFTMAYLSENPDGRAIIAVPTIDLIDQTIERMNDFNAMINYKKLNIGSFWGGEKNVKNQIIVTTYHSLNKLKDELKEKIDDVGLLLLDEAHHAVSERRANTVKSFTNAATYGMSGTPWYSPDRNVENLLGHTIAQISVPKSIREGVLAGCKNILMVSDFKVDLSKVKKNTNGDYDLVEYNKAIHKAAGNKTSSVNAEDWNNIHEHIAKEVAKFYQKSNDENVGVLNGKKCMINCRSQNEANIQAKELNKLFGYGYDIAKVWTSDTTDETILKGFLNGEFPIICQVGRLGEGFDMPDLEMCINYPTASRVLEAQRGGRPIRKFGNKMALVVDIAFAHPGYDNEIEAIHENGQVLYQDILGVPIIENEKQNKSERKENSSKDVVVSEEKEGARKLNLDGFHIISNTQELITLQKQAKENEANRIIPPIRTGMRTARGFGEYSIASNTINKIFNDLDEKKEMFSGTDGKQYPLVEWVKSSNNPCLALHEDPNAMKKLKELYSKFFASPIRVGMRTATGFGEYSISPFTISKIFNDLDEKKETFTGTDGKQYPLVKWIKSGSRVCLALHEDPNAMEKLKELYSKFFASPIRGGMRTARGFGEYSIASNTINKIFNDLDEKKEMFSGTDGKQYPLVEWVKSSNSQCLALHEDPNAMKKLKELYSKFFASPIRVGMRTSNGFGEYSISRETINKIFNDLSEKKETFTGTDGKQYPLVEWVKSGKKQCLALHEDPNAMKKLKELYSKFFASPIRVGMRTYNGFGEYSISRETINKIFNDLSEKKETFTGTDGKQYPLVEWVKSGSSQCLALHEDPNAMEAFKIYYKEKTGKELKKKNKSMPLKMMQYFYAHERC